MVQIVSGLNPKARMDAYLAGGDQQLKIHALKQQAEQNRAEQHAEMVKAIAAHKKEQAKALEDVNARAAMGDVQALRQQDMEAAANDLPPDEKRRMEYAKLRADPRIAGNEDALKELDEGYANLEKGIQADRQKKAAMSMIDTAVKDGIADPEEVKARLAAGEEPEQLGMEFAKAGQQRRKEAMALEKNSNAIKRARALLDSMPSEDNPDYDQALEAITALEQSASNQANPNSGKVMLDLVQRLASKGKNKDMQEDIMREPHEPFFFGAFGEGPMMTGGPTGPEGPTPGSHATLRQTTQLRQAIGGILQQTRDPKEITKLLQEHGVPLTTQLQTLLRQALANAPADATAQP